MSLVVETDVYISEAFDPKLITNTPKHVKYNAIWDTGATGSVITKKVVDDCGLQPIGMVNVSTAGGMKPCEVYLVNLLLPNHVGIQFLKVTQAHIHDGCDVLIGMDVITTGDFAITNKDNKTICSFRLPSTECIDFVKKHPKAHIVASKGFTRKSPCTCGSGKQYRKCCGKK